MVIEDFFQFFLPTGKKGKKDIQLIFHHLKRNVNIVVLCDFITDLIINI